MSARDELIATLADYPNAISHEGAEALIEARDAEVLREAADKQWALARQHWIPTDGDSPSAIRKKDHKFGAVERLISLIDPAAPAPMPRHINIIPKDSGFLVRWQLGEEMNSVWRASRTGADALAAELRAEGAGQAGKVIPTDETTQPADFFQPGHTYRRDSHGRYAEFRVTHVDQAPEGNYRCAFGWSRVEGYAGWHSRSDEDFNGWTEVPDGGAADA